MMVIEAEQSTSTAVVGSVKNKETTLKQDALDFEEAELDDCNNRESRRTRANRRESHRKILTVRDIPLQ